ncbi:MAG TPA: CHRD domain-containing protein [Gaiellaceae bacterium]|nr:CHRD domain-containing protein [Gaiellaceae bacterium]
MRRLTAVLVVCAAGLALVGVALANADRNYSVHLTGALEVPANDSQAQGQAVFQLSQDGESLSYRLIVANIENVTQAHIHLAPPGSNGGVVAWLYPSAPPAMLIPGRTDGNLATGTITAANLVGALAGQPLSALLEQLEAGNAYVNVHTSQFPGGEVRGNF